MEDWPRYTTKKYCVNRHVILFVMKIINKAKDTDHNLWRVSGYPCCLTFETTIFQSKPPSCIWKYVLAYYFSIAEKRKDSFFFLVSLSLFLNCRKKSLYIYIFFLRKSLIRTLFTPIPNPNHFIIFKIDTLNRYIICYSPSVSKKSG